MVIRHPRTASVVLGGGTPKNFINQASVQAEFFDDRIGGHRYALQIVTDVAALRRRLGLEPRRSAQLGQAGDRRRAGHRPRRRHHCPAAARQRPGRQRRARRLAAASTAALRFVRTDHGGRRAAVSRSRASRFASHGLSRSITITPRRCAFGGALPVRRSFDEAAVVILPVPVDRTTSYVGGTRNGPHEILQASSHMELWDEELRRRRPRHRHLHAARDGAAVRRDGAADRGD